MNTTSKWSSDEFLNEIRACSDPEADATVAALHARHGQEGHPVHHTYRVLFESLRDNSETALRRAPAELREFFTTTRRLPTWADHDRLEHGQATFTRHALPAALCLLAKSLPAGYAAPNLSIVLAMSGDLESHPYSRLLGVLQAVIETSSLHGFDARRDGAKHDGAAIVVAQKLRLLHSAIRGIADRKLGAGYRERAGNLPDPAARYGIPINHEDMLATIMGFSLLVLEGLDTLGVELTDDEREDYYLVWRVFAVMCGLHPADDPHCSDYVPETVAAAREFYASYQRRWFESDPRKNPEGVILARANLRMMKRLVPWWARLVGLGILPRVYMQELMGDAACRRIGIRTIPGFRLVRWVLLRLPELLMRMIGMARGRRGQWAMRFLQKLIVDTYGGKVEFFLPANLADVRRLAPPSVVDARGVKASTPPPSAATGT